MSNPLFKDTVTVTDIRGPRGNEIFAGVGGIEAVRVLHRDKPIKVVITEEFYLSLLTFWQTHDESGLARSSVAKMKQAARNQLHDITTKSEKKKSAS